MTLAEKDTTGAKTLSTFDAVSGPDADIVHLRLLATSDMHVNLQPWDYYTDTPTGGSLARAATLIAAARAEAANCILVDNGDFLQGSPMGDWVAQGRGLALRAHPVFIAMNHLRYDVATLGNHEFNYGVDFLCDALQAAEFPVVSANISWRDDRPVVPRWTILRREVTDAGGASHILRIGVIGFLPPQVERWDDAVLGGRIATEDIVAAARRHLPTLRAQCDLVVALSHSGIGGTGDAAGAENASTALAAVEGIDVVVAGHSHQLFPSSAFTGLADVDAQDGTLHGKPAVMPGFWGSHLGVIDLHLDAADWRIVKARSSLRSTEAVLPDAELQTVVQPDHRETLAYVQRPVGESQIALNSFFAMVTPTRAISLIAEAGVAHVAQTMGNALPILGSGLPFKAGGRGGPENFTRIPAGPLALRHVADIYCYPNTVAVLHLTGAEIAEWLERAAGAFCQIVPGLQEQPLLVDDFASYNFDVIHGLDFSIDLSIPAQFTQGGERSGDRCRIRDLRWNGAALDPEARFHVATSSYRAAGIGGFVRRAPVAASTRTMRDLLIQTIATRSPLQAEPEQFWRFVPMKGTSVTFDTSPEAIGHLHEVPHLSLRPVGMTERGFLRLRLDL